MFRLCIILFLLAPASWPATLLDPSLTNQAAAFVPDALNPDPAEPEVIEPTDTTIEIPSGQDTAPSVVLRPPKHTSIFRGSFGPLPPSANELARRTAKLLPPSLPDPTNTVATVSQEDDAERKTPTGGKYYWVDPDGADEAEGSKAKPWETLQHAAEQLQPGDIVLVRAGTYKAFHTTRSGEPEHPITFRAIGDVIVIPQDGVAPEGMKPDSMENIYRLDNITIKNSDYIVIDGFQVQRAGRCGISVLDSRGVILQNNVIGPVGLFGVLTGFAPEVQIIGNKTFGAARQHGIYVSNSRTTNDNPVVRFNESYNNGGNGIQVNGDCGSGGDGSITGAIIEGNLVHDNGLKGLSLISMSKSLVQNNLIYNNAKIAGAAGIHLTDELGCGHPSSGNVVVNNTVVESGMACIRLTDGAKDNIIFNNLLVGKRTLIDEVRDNKIDKLSNVCLDSPLGVFSNPEANDYHPLAGSPSIGVGLASYEIGVAPLVDREGNRRASAVGFDAGAY